MKRRGEPRDRKNLNVGPRATTTKLATPDHCVELLMKHHTVSDHAKNDKQHLAIVTAMSASGFVPVTYKKAMTSAIAVATFKDLERRKGPTKYLKGGDRAMSVEAIDVGDIDVLENKLKSQRQKLTIAKRDMSKLRKSSVKDRKRREEAEEKHIETMKRLSKLEEATVALQERHREGQDSLKEVKERHREAEERHREAQDSLKEIKKRHREAEERHHEAQDSLKQKLVIVEERLDYLEQRDTFKFFYDKLTDAINVSRDLKIKERTRAIVSALSTRGVIVSEALAERWCRRSWTRNQEVHTHHPQSATLLRSLACDFKSFRGRRPAISKENLEKIFEIIKHHSNVHFSFAVEEDHNSPHTGFESHVTTSRSTRRRPRTDDGDESQITSRRSRTHGK